MEVYRVTGDSPIWQLHAYNYIRTDAFCVGQGIPVEMEFNGDKGTEDFQGILVVEDHKPVSGLRIAYPKKDVAKIERVCTVREKQKGGYGRVMIEAAEQWIAEKGISHIVISSQDRAQGFYEKCGYVYNPEVSAHAYDAPRKKEEGEKPVKPAGFHPNFTCVLVEKYLDEAALKAGEERVREQAGSAAEDLTKVSVPVNSAAEAAGSTGSVAGADKGFGFATKCVYGNKERPVADVTGAISFPIYQSATFEHPEVGKSTGFDYGRLQNPTRAQVEKVVAALEGGIDALAFSTGMAAITALMEIFKPGDHIIADADLYGGSIRLSRNVCVKNGITFSHVNCSKENLEAFVKENTKAIFIETPTNPMMNVTDVRKAAEIAKRYGLLLIVDNTFLSPYFQKPLELGADVVIHSGTKFLGGHNDTLAGFIVTKSQEISERMRFLIKTVGSGLAPFDSWLILRGIKTLPLRMEKAQANAKAIANWLLQRPEVKKVYYPGIPGTEAHEICKSQASGFGSMLTFELESKELAHHVLKNTKLIPFAESLGGVETLLTYPTTQTHADVPEEVRLANGITERVLSLSAGIEDTKDLIADLEQAFDSFDK